MSTNVIRPPPPGIYVPAVLFFNEDESFDWPAIKSHVLRLAQGGVTGILVQGSNGEAQHLDADERKEAIRFTRQTLDDNEFQHVIVIAGTGGQSTRQTKKFCEDAKEAGASHALVLTPGVWPPAMTKENIIRFFYEVADASPIPVMIYNFPVVTAGIDLDSDILSDLASHPNIVGTKLSDGNIGKIQRLTSAYPLDEFVVYSGKADTFLHSLLAGSAGTISALANVVPKLHRKLWRLWEEGNVKEAMKLQAVLGRADWAVTKIGGIAGVKSMVVEHFGYGDTNVRGPLKKLKWAGLTKDKHTSAIEEVVALERAL